MKKIEDLKRDILEGKLEHFYVFYGEDYGIRKHYIDKIKTFFKSKFLISFNISFILLSAM